MTIALHIFFIALSCMNFINADSTETRTYYEELKKLKEKDPYYQMLFDKDASIKARSLIRDIENAKTLPSAQNLGLVDLPFLLHLQSFYAVVVTQESMPKLFSYVEELCRKNRIPTPIVGITQDECFLNAAAQKVFFNAGTIVIGQDLLANASDDVIEAVVAREIGHIKDNHANKTLLINTINISIVASLANQIMPNLDHFKHILFAKVSLAVLLGHAVSRLIIGKSFEKQADKFAYDTGNARGLIKFLNQLKKIELKEDEDFNKALGYVLDIKTKDPDNNKFLFDGHFRGYKLIQSLQWLYFNNPLVPYLSNEQRIKLAEESLEVPAEAAA